MPVLVRILIAIGTAVGQALYAVLKLLPVRHKVVFFSRQTDSPSLDFRLLAEELMRRDTSLEVVVRCRTLGDSLSARVGYLGELTVQLYHLATAKLCVADGHVIPVSALRHRDSLTVIQMWHALGAIKKFGYQALDRPSGRSSMLGECLKMHRNYDYVLCGGPATVPVFAEAFGVSPCAVLPLGLPRVDYLRSRATEASSTSESAIGVLESRFPLLAQRQRIKILYVPTFRKGARPVYEDVIRRFSSEHYALMVKPHELDRGEVLASDVIDVSDISVLDLLVVADVVITDYSAVAFETSVVNTPLYFYVYDIDDYRDRQGLNIDPLSAFPMTASQDIEEIGLWIDSGSYDSESAHVLFRDYLPDPQLSCTARIADLVFEQLDGGSR